MVLAGREFDAAALSLLELFALSIAAYDASAKRGGELRLEPREQTTPPPRSAPAPRAAAAAAAADAGSADRPAREGGERPRRDHADGGDRSRGEGTEDRPRREGG